MVVTPGGVGLKTAGRFDYEDSRTIEGRGSLAITSRDLAALRLERCLQSISDRHGRILEIGCGAGRHCRALKAYRPDLEVFGCDISETALCEAMAAGGGIEYSLGDAESLPFDAGFFDAVVLFDILEHVPDVRKAVTEIHRVLRPDGIVHGFIPCEGNRGTLFSTLGRPGWVPIHRWKRQYIGHIQQLTSSGIARLFAEEGFKVLSTSYSFHLCGQMLDFADYWLRDIRANHPENSPTVSLARLISRLVFIPTWRLAYYEDRLLQDHPAATGLHLTCVKTRAN
jgi:SAM-dependent methyltransferase